MSRTFERRHLFRSVVESAVRVLGSNADGPGQTGTLAAEADESILSDLTPELMKLEAERLGLDPVKDRSRIIASIREALQKPSGRGC
mgnify:CR=1 FL=1